MWFVISRLARGEGVWGLTWLFWDVFDEIFLGSHKVLIVLELLLQGREKASADGFVVVRRTGGSRFLARSE
jgi:hypothetical protein